MAEVVFASADNVGEAASALNAVARSFLGDAPPLQFSSAAPADAASIINSMGALLMGWKRARERADALDRHAAELQARLDASKHHLAGHQRSSHTETQLLRDQIAQREAEVQRQEKALGTAEHRESRREAELRRREREIEKMQARLSACHRGARDAQHLEMPVAAQVRCSKRFESGGETGAGKGPLAILPPGGCEPEDPARRTAEMLKRLLQASESRERAAAEEVRRLSGLVENLRAAVSELGGGAKGRSQQGAAHAAPAVGAEAAPCDCGGGGGQDAQWMAAMRQMAAAQAARVALSISVHAGRWDPGKLDCGPPTMGDPWGPEMVDLERPEMYADPETDLDECRRQLREQDALIRMALEMRMPRALGTLGSSGASAGLCPPELSESREGRLPSVLGCLGSSEANGRGGLGGDLRDNARSGDVGSGGAGDGARDGMGENEGCGEGGPGRACGGAKAFTGGRSRLAAQRVSLLAQQLCWSVPEGGELARFLDSLDAKLFTPPRVGVNSTPEQARRQGANPLFTPPFTPPITLPLGDTAGTPELNQRQRTGAGVLF
jgi:hypothetical protein